MGSGIVVVLALTVILFLPLAWFLPLLFQPQYVIAASLCSPYWDSCDAEEGIDTLKGGQQLL